MGFSQALSGINAAADNLDVVGNNISNSQTVGFKSSNTQFADVYAGAEVGLGTRVSGVMQDFSDGTLESSGRDLDLAISGDGFFRMTQNDQVVYSRNGQLSMTSDGYLQNAQGARLTGYPAGVGAGGQPEELQVPSDALEATATTGVEASLNLDSGAEEITDPFGAADPADYEYSYSNSATVYDSLGNSHDVTMYFAKTGDNTWEMTPTLDGAEPEAFDSDNDPVELTFDADGTLTGQNNKGGGDPEFTFNVGAGADPVDFEMDFTGSTQFGNDFELSSLNQDGYSSGSLVGTTIDESGNIIGNYSNEESQVLGTIAMANFRNPEGLEPVGDNAWAETSESGQALLGQAGEGVFGSIESGTIETSNVDLNGELVDLIIAQRNYQANSQTVKVQDEVLQGTVNLR